MIRALLQIARHAPKIAKGIGKGVESLSDSVKKTHKKKVKDMQAGHKYDKDWVCVHCGRTKESIYLFGGKCGKKINNKMADGLDTCSKKLDELSHKIFKD